MDDAELDPDSLRLDGDPAPKRGGARKPVAPYLRGPIPWAWIRRAESAGSAALTAGLAVWHYRALRKATTFPISLRDICRLTDQSPKTARRGLSALESAGLISRTSKAGRKPQVAIR